MTDGTILLVSCKYLHCKYALCFVAATKCMISFLSKFRALVITGNVVKIHAFTAAQCQIFPFLFPTYLCVPGVLT